MVICHISDTHGAKFHSKLQIPECDVLIHSGDIGNRTNTLELTEFLIWFEKQPAKKKIFIAGNHDLCLDENWVKNEEKQNVILGLIARQQYNDSINLLKSFDVEYLMNSGCEYDGIKFWGSPYSISFHRDYWAFNADEGREIKKYWDMIPEDTDVAIIHTPVYDILDKIGNGELKGSKLLRNKINKIKPILFLCGHIHESYGTYSDEHTLYSNGSVLNKGYILSNKPILIDISIINEGFKEIKLL